MQVELLPKGAQGGTMPRQELFCDWKDYELYLERYEWQDNSDLPMLSQEEFCRLQEELMGLLADRAAGGRLSSVQQKRLRELRRLLFADL